MFLIDTDTGHAAIRTTSGKAGLMLAEVLRARPFSVTFGAVAGAVLHRLAHPRLFCYSALTLPLFGALSWGYFLFVDPSPLAAPMPPSRLGELFWAYLCVYGWYFLAIALSYAIAAKLRVPKVA